MSIEERIRRLEERISSYGGVPGTQICRVLKPAEGVQWCLSIGPMMGVKDMFYGDTLDFVVSLAEKATRILRAENP